MKAKEASISVKILSVCVLLLFFFNCYLLCKRVVIVSENGDKDRSVVDLKTKYLSATIDYMENSGLYIGDNLFTDLSTHKQYDLSKLFSETDNNCFLVCRISEFDCEQCANYAVQKMMKHINDSTLNIKMLLFGQYNNENSIKIIRDNYSEMGEMDCYYVPNLNLPIDDRNIPYYFVVDKTLKVSDVFAPDRMTAQLTDIYFSEMKKKWSRL